MAPRNQNSWMNGYQPFKLPSRNNPSGFAERTRKNLELIERAYSVGADVHVVTQLMLSLLGIIVFPWEHDSFRTIGEERSSSLAGAGISRSIPTRKNVSTSVI